MLVFEVGVFIILKRNLFNVNHTLSDTHHTKCYFLKSFPVLSLIHYPLRHFGYRHIMLILCTQRTDNSVTVIYIYRSTLPWSTLIWINKLLPPTHLPFVCAVAVTRLTSSVTCVLSLSRLPRKNGVADLDLLRNSLTFSSSILIVSDYIVTFKARQKFSTASTIAFYYMNSYSNTLKQRKFCYSLFCLPTFCIMFAQ
jgi:hypothetical protein